MEFTMSTNMTVKVHSVVLVSIIDSFERRNDSQNRVIGSLLGFHEKGAVVIKNCICIPHNESEDEVAVDMEFAKSMFESYKKVESSETIVGWYATGADVTSHSLLIHDYYSRETTNPIHLIVDTTLREGKINCKAFVSVPYGISSKNPGIMFTPCIVEHIGYEQEYVGLGTLQETKYNKQRSAQIETDIDKIGNAVDEILKMIGDVVKYVDDVLNNQTAPNNTIGRILLDMIESLPQIDPEEFSEMINNRKRDFLMLFTLAQLLRTHVAIQEKAVAASM